MVKNLPEYVVMFKEEDRPLHITIQIEEHFVRIDEDQPGYAIVIDSFRNLPVELLRYAADDTITLGLKYYGG